MDERTTEVCNRAEFGLLYNLFLALCCKWLVVQASWAKFSVQTGFIARFGIRKEKKQILCAVLWGFCSFFVGIVFSLNRSVSILQNWPFWSPKRLQRIQTSSRTSPHPAYYQFEVPKLICSIVKSGLIWNNLDFRWTLWRLSEIQQWAQITNCGWFTLGRFLFCQWT